MCSGCVGAGCEDEVGGVVVARAPSIRDVRVEEDGFHEEFKEAPVFAYKDRAGPKGCVGPAGKVRSVYGLWGAGADSSDHTEACKGFAPEAGGA